MAGSLQLHGGAAKCRRDACDLDRQHELPGLIPGGHGGGLAFQVEAEFAADVDHDLLDGAARASPKAA